MKVIFELDYKKYVLEASTALTLMEILGNAEVYKYCYISAANSPTGVSMTTHHVFVDQTEDRRRINMYPITELAYKMAKLAGAPTE